jgi:mRNA interferase RelE/StbE
LATVKQDGEQGKPLSSVVEIEVSWSGPGKPVRQVDHATGRPMELVPRLGDSLLQSLESIGQFAGFHGEIMPHRPAESHSWPMADGRITRLSCRWIREQSRVSETLAARPPLNTASVAGLVSVRLGSPTGSRRVGKQLLLPSYEGTWSARRGTYRVLYEIDDEQLIVTVTVIEHRADAYRLR